MDEGAIFAHMGPKAVSPAGKCCCTGSLSVLLWIHLDRYLCFVLSQHHVKSLGPVLMLEVHRAGRIIGAGVLNLMFTTRNSRMAFTWTLTLCNYAGCWLTAHNFFHLLLFPTNKGNMDNVHLFPLIFFTILRRRQSLWEEKRGTIFCHGSKMNEGSKSQRTINGRLSGSQSHWSLTRHGWWQWANQTLPKRGKTNCGCQIYYKYSITNIHIPFPVDTAGLCNAWLVQLFTLQ